MMGKGIFIKTTDPHCADILRKAGYPELTKEGATFVFLNDPGGFTSVTFGANDKVVYTNSIEV